MVRRHRLEWRIARPKVRDSDPVYAAMIESIDQSVGRILATRMK